MPQRRDTARKIESLASHELYFPCFTTPSVQRIAFLPASPIVFEGRSQSPSPLDTYKYTWSPYIWQWSIVYQVAYPRYLRDRHIGRRTRKKTKRPAELIARRTAMPYPACRPPYRLERVGERLVFPQMNVDAGVFGGGVEQLLNSRILIIADAKCLL